MEQIVFQTALGYVALARGDCVLLALVFGHSTERSASRTLALCVKDLELPVDDLSASGYQTDDLVDRLREFARGEPTDFSDVAVETRGARVFSAV